MDGNHLEQFLKGQNIVTYQSGGQRILGPRTLARPRGRTPCILDDLAAKHRSSRHAPEYEWMRAQLPRVFEHFEQLQEMAPISDRDF